MQALVHGTRGQAPRLGRRVGGIEQQLQIAGTAPPPPSSVPEQATRPPDASTWCAGRAVSASAHVSLFLAACACEACAQHGCARTHCL